MAGHTNPHSQALLHPVNKGSEPLKHQPIGVSTIGSRSFGHEEPCGGGQPDL